MRALGPAPHAPSSPQAPKSLTQSRRLRALAAAAATAGVALTGLLSPAADAATTTNFGFSSGLTGWNEITPAGTATLTSGRTGRAARLSHARSTAYSVALRAPKVSARTVAGASYTGRIWVRASRATTVNLRLVETAGSRQIAQVVSSNRVGTGWTELGVNHTAKSANSRLELFVHGYRLAPGAALDVDDLEVTIRRAQWRDEFNGTTVDPTSWNVLDNAAVGAASNEQSCYLNRPANVTVSRGALQLIGRRENALSCGTTWPQIRDYSSGFVTTAGKRTFTYGRFEMRAQFPTGRSNSQGLWTAFWLWPQDQGPGELDVVEAIGTSAARPNEARRVHQFIHYDALETNPQQGQAYTFPRGEPSDGYHQYALEWTPSAVYWFVDGAMTYKRDASTTPWLRSTFTRPMHLRLNLTVGASWPGTPNAATALPATYAIDYVRVYR